MDIVTSLSWLGAGISLAALTSTIMKLSKRGAEFDRLDAESNPSIDPDRLTRRSTMAQIFPELGFRKVLLSDLHFSRESDVRSLGWLDDAERIRPSLLEATRRKLFHDSLLSECLNLISAPSVSSTRSDAAFRHFAFAFKPENQIDRIVRYLTFSIPEERSHRAWCHAFTKSNFKLIVLDSLEETHSEGSSRIWKIPAGLDDDKMKMMIITCHYASAVKDPAASWLDYNPGADMEDEDEYVELRPAK